jgi:ribosomal protein S18 acetylase RimI-like enzyme
MHPRDSIKRFFQYAKRHGFRATMSRIGLSCNRALTGRWHVLFVCDLTTCQPLVPADPNHAKVERKNTEAELSGQDLLQITSAWNPKIARRQLSERFANGASLWLFKLDGNLAAYGWTIIGRTVEPHFFPLGANDAHLFDYFVFPEFRGRRINPALVNHILASLASERRSRAFIEAAEWNTPQMSSLRRTPFQAFGRAWKGSLFGKTLVIWCDQVSKPD